MKNIYNNLKETFTRKMCGYCNLGQDWHAGVVTVEVIYGDELIDHNDIKRMFNDIAGFHGITEDIPNKIIEWFKSKQVKYVKCTYELGNVLNTKIEMEWGV